MSLLVLLALPACADEKSDVETRRQLEILKQMAAETPLYPGFVHLSGDDRYKGNTASVSRCYTARVNDVEVKRFYTQRFESQGWKLAKKEELSGLLYEEGRYTLTFQKDAYAVTFANTHQDNRTGRCDFTFIYYWNMPTPLIDLGIFFPQQ